MPRCQVHAQANPRAVSLGKKSILTHKTRHAHRCRQDKGAQHEPAASKHNNINKLTIALELAKHQYVQHQEARHSNYARQAHLQH